MKSLILAFTVTLSSLIGGHQALAQSAQIEMNLSGHTGWYSTGGTLAHRFSTPTYIERLLISAEGNRSFAKANVYADGELISVMGVPGNDPDYPMIVRKTISSIVIKFEGSVYIRDMRAYGITKEAIPAVATFGGVETPLGLANMVMATVASLQQTASDTEFRQYLLPLRKAAMRLAAKGGGRSLLSSNTQAQAQVMINEISKAEPFLDRLSDRTFYSQAVQNLLFVREKLQSVYEIY